jgi:hypothetical protein
MKNKWFGKCNICEEETKLMTVHLTLDCGINYWIKKSCSKCIKQVRDSIYDAIGVRSKKK